MAFSAWSCWGLKPCSARLQVPLHAVATVGQRGNTDMGEVSLKEKLVLRFLSERVCKFLQNHRAGKAL